MKKTDNDEGDGLHKETFREGRISAVVKDEGFEIHPGVLAGEDVCALLNGLEGAPIAASDCTVPRGGIVVMQPLLVHASSKAASAEPRRVVHIEYAASLALGSELELRVA